MVHVICGEKYGRAYTIALDTEKFEVAIKYETFVNGAAREHKFRVVKTPRGDININSVTNKNLYRRAIYWDNLTQSYVALHSKGEIFEVDFTFMRWPKGTLENMFG